MAAGNVFDQLAAQPQSQPNAVAPAAPPSSAGTGNVFDQLAAQNKAAITPSTQTAGPQMIKGSDGQMHEYTPMWGDTVADTANSILMGEGKGVAEAAHTVGAAVGHLMPKGMRDRLALPTSFTEPGYLKSENGAETAGKVGESIAEFALGDEALKGLQMSEKLGIAQKLASMAKGSPYIARMLELGMNALRGGVTTVPQQMLHGASPADALTTGAVATGVGAGVGAATEAATPLVKAALRGGQPEVQAAIRNAGQTATEQAEARSAAVKAAEPVRVHPPDIDPAIRDHARLNPFPGEDVKIKTAPGTPARGTEEATNPTARITGPNGSSIELELDGKTARVKGIINSGKPGDGQRLYDNAIEWAKDSGYDTFEGDKVQTQEGKTAWQRISERHNARLSDKGVSSIDLTGSRPTPEGISVFRGGKPGTKGQWFTENKDFADQHVGNDRELQTRNIQPKNPIDLSTPKGSKIVSDAIKKTNPGESVSPETIQQGLAHVDPKLATELRNQGYDWITTMDNGGEKTGRVWIDLNHGTQSALTAPNASAITPSAGIRTSVEDVSNAVKAKSQGVYQQLDQASGGRWQRYDDALKNIQDKMDEVNGVDDDAYDRLETKRNDIETSQAQMIEDLKAKGIDPKTADAAVAHYKQAMALRDLDKAVKASTTGDIASGATKSESVNPKAFTARIQKLYDSGRLKQAVGDSGAKALLQEAYAAKSAQAVQQVVKRIAVYAGIGAAMGAGAHATHIFNHLTGTVEPIQ